MRITIRQGAGAGQIIVVDRPLTLGRDADVDVVLNDALVSTRHATLSPFACLLNRVETKGCAPGYAPWPNTFRKRPDSPDCISCATRRP